MNAAASEGPGQREIIHCDMDAFYAAVEQLDFPELRGRPVIVGGDLQRGVVSACSYEARRFGVHSALPMARAVQRCPGAVLRPVRMARYREVSRAVFAILGRYSDRIEPLSIDEAFLDVSGCRRLFGPARDIAEAIRREVRQELGLAISAGIAPNKFLAKLASQQAKPDGLLEIVPAAVERFLAPLPVAALWGVGAVTEKQLRARGIATVGELRNQPRAVLIRLFGQGGEHLYRLARGQDERPVVTTAEIKSVSHEETFARDLQGCRVLARELRDLAERVAARLRAKGLRGRRITLKVRYGDFSAVTRSRTLERGVDNGLLIYQTALELMEQTEVDLRPVRLLGVGVADWRDGGLRQGELFTAPESEERRRALDRAVDQVHQKFGRARLGPADLAASAAEKGGDPGE